MKYVSKMIEHSPMLEDSDEKIKKCIIEMENEGYELKSSTDTGIAWTILVFAKQSNEIEWVVTDI